MILVSWEHNKCRTIWELRWALLYTLQIGYRQLEKVQIPKLFNITQNIGRKSNSRSKNISHLQHHAYHRLVDITCLIIQFTYLVPMHRPLCHFAKHGHLIHTLLHSIAPCNPLQGKQNKPLHRKIFSKVILYIWKCPPFYQWTRGNVTMMMRRCDYDRKMEIFQTGT